MKRIFSILLFCTVCVILHAQDIVHFEFSDGIENAALKSKMEQQVSALLTAINRAETNHSAISYSGIDIDERTTQSINKIWNAVHFRIVDDDIVEHCHRVKNGSGTLVGYQVRNIAVEIKPLDNSYNGVRNQEVSLNLDLDGAVTGLDFTQELNLYVKTSNTSNRPADGHVSETAYTDRTAFGLKGNVKKVIQNGNVDVIVYYFGTEWISCNLEFSQSGNLVRVNGLKGGKKIEDMEGEYFAADYEEFKEATKDVPEGVFVFSDIPEFGLVRDSDGRIIKRVHLVIGCEEDWEEWETLQYDDKGRVVFIKLSVKNPDEKNFTDTGDYIKYFYDENDNVIKAVWYESGEKKSHTITYQYKKFDREGNWLVRVANCEDRGPINEMEQRIVEY